MKKKELVYYTLLTHPKSRENDMELIGTAAREGDKITRHEKEIRDKISKKIGSFESYTRARRSCQKENPHLKPDKVVQKMRAERSELMRRTKGDVDATNDIMF